MGAGVGPLIAPAVFRVVVEFKDVGGGPIAFLDPGPSIDPCKTAEPGAGGKSHRERGAPQAQSKGDDVRIRDPEIYLDFFKSISKDPQVSALCKNSQIVWLPTRRNPGDPNSPITGGLFLISGDLSLAEATKLNCGLDDGMRGAREKSGNKVALRAGANIGPAADRNSPDWGNIRGASSTATDVFCAPKSPQ